MNNNKMTEDKQLLTKKDRRSAVWRFTFIGANTLNFGTFMGNGYAWAMAPVLRKIYPNDEEYIKAMETEFEYFNATPQLVPLFLGADVALQEENGLEALETVRSIKTSLMGPISGLGDSLIWVLYPTIMGSIGGYMALEGNPLGAILWIALNFLLILLRIKLFDLGYSSGIRLITDLSEKLNAFTEAASVMGLTVVGSLIASVIKVVTPISFKFGEVKMSLQTEIFDAIIPKLLPIILVGIVYWLMEKRKWKFLNIVILLIVFSLVASFFGILSVPS